MIAYKKDADNIVTLTLDMEGRTENIINQKIWSAFIPVLAQLKQEKVKGKLRGVILTSAKKTFMAGGDLEYLFQAADAAEIFAAAEGLKKFLRDLESPGVPVVAAINGDAIAAGFEVALGCHHRIVLDDPDIRVGLPEVEMGLIPSGGSIVRLMWLLGIVSAYGILCGGKRYHPRAALQAGIIDELAATPEEMIKKAKAWLLRTVEGRRPWDVEGRTIPAGTAREPEVGRQIMAYSAALSGQFYSNNPAPQAILHILAEGSKVTFDVACRLESRYYTQLVLSRTCKNMIKAFWFDANAIHSGIERPRGFGKFRPKKIGIIGAGQMGSGIAVSCLLNGMEVVLKDVSRPVAGRGLEIIVQALEDARQAGEFLPDAAEALASRVFTTEDSRDFADCDLVIEAVFENLPIKEKVAREAERYLDEYAFLASNTISIPISHLAAASSRPESFIGLHFFHPADKVPLVEIVRGNKTSGETVARAFDFVRALKKTPVIVKDDWGFYAARVRNTYILEGISLLQEGYAPALVENLSRQAGMPGSPLALADELGMELVLTYEQQAAAHYGPQYIKHPAADLVMEMLGRHQRPGMAGFAGFYDYTADGDRKLWPGLAQYQGSVPPDPDYAGIIERLLIAQVLEAVWCMQEGVVQSVEAANLGSIYGWGFPAARGGVIQFIHDCGIETFLQKCKALREKLGPRFRTPGILKRFPF
ncbi:MAG: 3-hydroxyacyl-CoA dehydrogenase NAD-binding domain-containing protein [Saprospiraceae bacterium]